MSSASPEQIFVEVTSFQQNLQRQIGEYGLQLADEQLETCTEYEFRVGSQVIGKRAKGSGRSLLGSPAMVPEVATDWSQTLGLQVEFHHPFNSDCPHSIDATVAVQRGEVQYDPNTGKLILEKTTVRHTIDFRNGPGYTIHFKHSLETYGGQLPGAPLGQPLTSRQVTDETFTTLSGDDTDTSLAHATGQLTIITADNLDWMQGSGQLDEIRIARRFRLPVPEA